MNLRGLFLPGFMRLVPLLALLLAGSRCLQAQPVIISEFMAANIHGLTDEDRETSDWIELENLTGQTVSLEGWHLSNQADLPNEWTFPDTSIAPHGFLLVFASGKDRRIPGQPLHTNFKLSRQGEYLALTQADGSIAFEYSPEFPLQSPDVSFGAVIPTTNDGSTNPAPPETPQTGFFFPPTPGTPNGPVLTSVLAPPKFSRPAGTFTQIFDLTLSEPSPQTILHYTLDGSVPTQTSSVYTDPIQITGSTRVRARAFQPGFAPSPVQSKIYTRLDPSLLGFSSNLPLVLLDNFGQGAVPANRKQSAVLAIWEPIRGRSSLTNPPSVDTRAGIGIRGSSTLNRPKKAFSVETWDEEDQDAKITPLGMPAESDWILYAPYNFDRALIRNAFVYRLSNDIGRYAVRTHFVEAFVKTSRGPLSNADYAGVYVFMEKIKRGKNRVNVEKLLPTDVTAPNVQGGYMLKIDRLDPGDSGLTAGGQLLAFVDPKEHDIGRAQRMWIQRYLDSFARALDGPLSADPTAGYAHYIDVDAWIDHHIINEFTKNPDGLRLSTYMYKPRFGKLTMGPVWDFDRTMGPNDDARAADPVGWSSVFYYGWWNQLFEDPNFWQKYIDRWTELRRGPLSIAHLNGIVDSMAAQLSEAEVRNFQRWPLALGRGGWPGQVAHLKDWIDRRAAWIDSQFPAAPILSPSGGVVAPGTAFTLQAPGGKVYYTLDGTDPRLPGGQPSPTALEFQFNTPPVKLWENREVFARAFYGEPVHPWSAPARAFLVQRDLPALALTEVMYHPAKIPEVSPWNNDDFEFVELQNRGLNSVNLIGMRFDQGIQFTFPNLELAPGKTALVVKNQAAFATRYPVADLRIAGEYEGNLSNNGEALRLRDPAGRTIFSFTYGDSAPWPTAADGHGASLERVFPSADLQDPGSWRASPETGGSPGTAPPLPIQINDLEWRNGTVVLRFPSTPGARFQVESRDQLGSGGWQIETNVFGPVGTNTLRLTLPVPASAAQRYYRLIIP